MAVACTPFREAALGTSLQSQPVVHLRLLLQPVVQALLQRLLLAAAAAAGDRAEADEGCCSVKGTSETSKQTADRRSNSSSRSYSLSSRLFASAAQLLCQVQGSPLAFHLLELCQFGLLMRCIATYAKAAKTQGQQLRRGEQLQHHPTDGAAKAFADGGDARGDSLEANAAEKRAAALAALVQSHDGLALQRLLQLLQQQCPQLFVGTMVACMRKTEPLVSPAVLSCLLHQGRQPADPAALFTICMDSGMLQTASLYLLPIQAAEGPLEVSLPPFFLFAVASYALSLPLMARCCCWLPGDGFSVPVLSCCIVCVPVTDCHRDFLSRQCLLC